MNANLCIGMVWNARGWTPPPRAYRTKSAQVRIGSGVAKPLDDIEDALRLWHGAGLLQTTHEDPFTPSRNFCFYFRGDALILKSQRCARKHRVGHACQVCLDGAAHKGLRLEAVKWASKIHLANYAHALAYGTATERRDMRAELRLQDVYQTREGRLEIESVLKEEQEAFQLQMIKHRWQSIRLDWRTSRLQAYIDAHIGSLPLRAAKEQQREVLRPRAACGTLTSQFADAVEEGTVRQENLVLASRIATGELDGNAVWSQAHVRSASEDQGIFVLHAVARFQPRVLVALLLICLLFRSAHGARCVHEEALALHLERQQRLTPARVEKLFVALHFRHLDLGGTGLYGPGRAWLLHGRLDTAARTLWTTDLARAKVAGRAL
eukprot:s2133_g16.t1